MNLAAEDISQTPKRTEQTSSAAACNDDECGVDLEHLVIQCVHLLLL